MKGILMSLAILAFPASLFAQLALPSPDVAGELTPKLKDALLPTGETGPYLQAESAAIGKELATAKLADMTLAEPRPTATASASPPRRTPTSRRWRPYPSSSPVPARSRWAIGRRGSAS